MPILELEAQSYLRPCLLEIVNIAVVPSPVPLFFFLSFCSIQYRLSYSNSTKRVQQRMAVAGVAAWRSTARNTVRL